MNIDASEFDFSDPTARYLHDHLMRRWRRPPEVEDLVGRAGAPDWSEVDFQQPIRLVWADTLRKASAQGGLRTLLTYVSDQEKVHPTLADLLRDLLADRPAAFDAGAGGTKPGFDDTISQPEARLFGDDLTEPVGRVEALIDGIRRVMQWRSQVCRVRVAVPGLGESMGTGLLLAGDLVLTNHHVLAPGGQVVRVTCDFGYERDANGALGQAVEIGGAIESIVSDPVDDWGVVRLAEAPPVEGYDLTRHRLPVVGERAFVLQHPGGREKRIGFVRNAVSSVADRRVYYLTDTEPGSSGAPVFGSDGQLVAIHRAGGTPNTVAGATPVMKNEGVRIDRVVDALKKALQ